MAFFYFFLFATKFLSGVIVVDWISLQEKKFIHEDHWFMIGGKESIG
jgi:hypothetical protein